MDLRALFDDANREATALITNLSAEQLGRPTPCTDWTVRALVNHMVATTTTIGGARERGSLTKDELTGTMGADLLGDAEPAQTWSTAADRLAAAFRPADALSSTVEFGHFGQVPGELTMNIAVFDITTHCADLARATGRPMPADQLLESALAIGQGLLSGGRSPEAFGPEQPAAPGDPAGIRLLAFTGRKL